MGISRWIFKDLTYIEPDADFGAVSTFQVP